jgi:uncharacterized protein YggE
MNERFEFFGNNSIRIAVVGVLAILALFLFAETLLAVQGVGNPPAAADTITVSGQGQVSLAPDIARITFTVQNTAAKVADAQDATTKQANAAIDWVKGQGIASKDITTLSYSIMPQYSYKTCPPGAFCPSSGTITGYQVAETVQVTVRNLDQVADLLGGLGQQNVQNISGPNFGLETPNAGQEAARGAAITDAQTQAATLAKQLGVRLGRVVSFSEGGNGPYPVAFESMAAGGAAKAATPEIPAGENTYTDTVTITYAIR